MNAVDPGWVGTVGTIFEKFGVVGGIVIGIAWALHKGWIRLGRETDAEKRASAGDARIAELLLTQARLEASIAKYELAVTEWRSIAMRSMNVTQGVVSTVEKKDGQQP